MQSTSTIVYFKQGLGNLILLTPTLQALAQMDESKKIDICLSSEWNDYRRNAFDEYISVMPFVQNIINFPAQQFTKKYTVWFYTAHSEHSEALDVFRSHDTINLSIPDWKASMSHEAVWYFEHVLAMGYDKLMPGMYVPVKQTEKTPILPNNKLKIGLCNGTFCNMMKGAKQWPYFKELAETLKNYYECNIITIGTGDELQDVKSDFNFVDKLSFLDSANIINQLDLFIVNDTANMHVGDALQVNMIVLFGGSFISKNAPLSSTACVVRKNLDCQPCQSTESFKNCEKNTCLTCLTISDVFSVCDKKLNWIINNEKY